MGDGLFVEKSNFHSSLEFLIGKEVGPDSLQDMSNQEIVILWKPFKNTEKGIPVLLQEYNLHLGLTVKE